MQIPMWLLLVRLYVDVALVCVVWIWTMGWPPMRLGLTKALVTAPQKRIRHPQSPCDCPACSAKHKQLECTKDRENPAWPAQHSGRGRPKQVRTDGHSCNNPACLYYQVTESRVHALVGYGTHRGRDSIQYFKCQACGTKVTARWNTPMYDLKTSASEVARVMTATSEGVDVAAA